KCDEMEDALRMRLLSMCNKADADYDKCIEEAAMIASTLGETCRNNWKINFRPITQKCNGYWCYEWAYGYERAVKKLKPECFNYAYDYASETEENFFFGAAQHSWLELERNGKCVYVDDGFWDPNKTKCVWDERPCGGKYVHQGGRNRPRLQCDPVTPYPPVE